MPKITVLMPTYNASPTIDAAIKSILDQSFKDFLFLIVDNGSTDSTVEKIMEWKDSRIIGHFMSENTGTYDALNTGLDIIGTPYIARMDADDISGPNRLERQLLYMEDHGLDICGTWAFVTDGSCTKEAFHPVLDTIELKKWMCKMCFFIHGSVMYKKSIIDDVGGYSSSCINDYELWFRILDKYKGGIVPGYHYILFDHKKMDVPTEKTARIYNEAKALREHWATRWGIQIPENDLPDFRTRYEI